MKKTSIFNLGGNACYFDEDAAAVLQEYLDRLRNYFGDKPSTDEVMNDIEARLWEIFEEHKRYGMQVVGLQEVNEAIGILGEPEEIGKIEDDEPTTNDAGDEPKDNTDNDTPNAEPQKRIPRKLFRDPQNRIFGGVCSGLGTYFGISEVLMRLLFIGIVLVYGSGVAIYIILWIIMPKARTTAQRLEMQGISPSAENIHDYITANGADTVLPSRNDGCLRFIGFGCGGMMMVGCLPFFLLILGVSLVGFLPIPSEISTELLNEFPQLAHVSFDGTDATLFHCCWIIPAAILLVWVYNKLFPRHRLTINPYAVMAILLVWIAILITFAMRMSVNISYIESF
ncbi:MAG: PspC domain-containing protein [Coprobacter sp.]|nr:PspC domain-containing protein [Coprobacter sp.]